MLDKTKLVDFLTEKIFEESKDASAYIENATAWTSTMVKSTLNKIAEEEQQHQKMLIKLLGDIAKGTEEGRINGTV